MEEKIVFDICIFVFETKYFALVEHNISSSCEFSSFYVMRQVNSGSRTLRRHVFDILDRTLKVHAYVF